MSFDQLPDSYAEAMGSTAMRRMLRVSRLVQECGFTDVIDALEALKAAQEHPDSKVVFTVPAIRHAIDLADQKQQHEAGDYALDILWALKAVALLPKEAFPQ
jgi:orotidine-5'-phosphate decarboxylase